MWTPHYLFCIRFMPASKGSIFAELILGRATTSWQIQTINDFLCMHAKRTPAPRAIRSQLWINVQLDKHALIAQNRVVGTPPHAFIEWLDHSTILQRVLQRVQGWSADFISYPFIVWVNEFAGVPIFILHIQFFGGKASSTAKKSAVYTFAKYT